MLRFKKETGIARDAWLGKFWRRWNEAVEEAGFTPNAPTPAVERDELLKYLAQLTRENRRFPTDADLSIAKVNGARLPHKHAFRKLGGISIRIDLVRAYARKHSDYEDILPYLPESVSVEPIAQGQPGRDGAVYMLKLGKHYKIGKSFRVPQRHREIAIELPEKPDVVHVITTDDPAGIEAYWHNRFVEKRTNGEWFSLSREDVAAFKRRRFM